MKKPSLFIIAISLAMPLLAMQSPVENKTGENTAQQPAVALITDQRLVNAATETDNWLSHGRTYDEQRFSPLDDINDSNVSRLGLAWSFEFPDHRELEATPLVADGVIYVSGSWSRVFALDATTGKLLWSYDPGVRKEMLVRACCGPVNRGVALWQDKVYVGTLDGYLVAIDRHTGQEQWRTLTIDPAMDYSITGAPRVVKGKVLIGNGGAEYGVRGYVSAYDATTGERVWRFYTVPGNPALGFENEAMKMAAETWRGKWWSLGGGGTVWDSIAYDPQLNMVYVGVGNGSPWNREIRSPGGGDNLFLSSIVALDADTGEYRWHYQTTPGESWDFTATQQMILADIEWQGKQRQVLMQAPKNGFFFIIDRTNGEFLSAKNFTKVLWAEGYDAKGRPIEKAGARYLEEAFLMMPGAVGGHNWHSMAYHPGTGLVYIPVIKSLMKYRQPGKYNPTPHHQNVGADLPSDPPVSQEFGQVLKEKSLRGELLAWDPVQQKERWRHKHARTWNGGVLATGGNLVFQGTADQQFMAFSADHGKVLWSFDARLGIVAAPVTYRVDGRQYVAVMAKWGGGLPLALGVPPLPGLEKGRLLVFSLDGEARLPEVAVPDTVMEKPVAMTLTDSSSLDEGKRLYTIHCAGCHGMDVISSGLVPDLRYRAGQYNLQAFNVVVLDGVLASRGMVNFADVLDTQSSAQVYNYILQQAHHHYALQQEPGWWTSIKRWFYDKLSDLLVWLMDKA